MATIGLTIVANGKLYAATVARSMIAGAIAFCLYACLASRLMLSQKMPAAQVTIPALGFWLACSISIWLLALR